jgi:uncharacterized membrane protein YbhN (UPF0104 family)
LTQLDIQIISDIAGWCSEVWDQIRSVDIQYLILGCFFQSVQTVLNGLAWRNILSETYGPENVPRRPMVSAYAGGIGLNSFLPAQAGTFAYFGMFRVIIVGSSFTAILAAGVVQNLFFGVIGTLNYVYLFATRTGSVTRSEHQVSAHSGWKIAFLIAAALLVVIVLRVLWRKLRDLWQNAKQGAVILTRPRRYVTHVLALQVASYISRMCVNATFMYAFGIPVSVRNIFLIIAANSVSSTFAVTPGGVGTQQAMASVALRKVAPASTVTAYSLSQQLIMCAWNITFGLVLMATTFGWSSTRELISESRKGSKEKRSLSDLAKQDEQPQAPEDSPEQPVSPPPASGAP